MAPKGPFGGMNAPSAMMQGGKTMVVDSISKTPLQWEVECTMTLSHKAAMASTIRTTHAKPKVSGSNHLIMYNQSDVNRWLQKYIWESRLVAFWDASH